MKEIFFIAIGFITGAVFSSVICAIAFFLYAATEESKAEENLSEFE